MWGEVLKRRLVFFFFFLCFFSSSSSSFTGITPEQSKTLTEKAHIYLTQNGRISMAGLNTHNIRYFAENLDKVVRGEL
jgi:aspartate/tyrosine/aromatic aminotransferase